VSLSLGCLTKLYGHKLGSGGGKPTWESLFGTGKWAEEEVLPSDFGAAQESWRSWPGILHFSQPWSFETVPALACGTPYLEAHLGTSIIRRGIFSSGRFCSTKQEQRNSACTQQQHPATLLQRASTQAARAAAGNQPPHAPLKQGLGHSLP